MQGAKQSSVPGLIKKDDRSREPVFSESEHDPLAEELKAQKQTLGGAEGDKELPPLSNEDDTKSHSTINSTVAKEDADFMTTKFQSPI